MKVELLVNLKLPSRNGGKVIKKGIYSSQRGAIPDKVIREVKLGRPTVRVLSGSLEDIEPEETTTTGGGSEGTITTSVTEESAKKRATRRRKKSE